MSTTMNVREMPAGVEMDALVAREVMGWKKGNPRADRWVDARGELQAFIDIWSPSTSTATAFEALRGWEGDYDIRRQNGQFRVELFRPSEGFEVWGETLPLAACRALLLAAVRV